MFSIHCENKADCHEMKADVTDRLCYGALCNRDSLIIRDLGETVTVVTAVTPENRYYIQVQNTHYYIYKYLLIDIIIIIGDKPEKTLLKSIT
jgi:hypothetical protein